MSELPIGTITFLFTDIEGSTVRWERYPEEMRQALARHDELLLHIMEAHQGVVFKTVGDAFYVAFATAGDAVRAAIAAQRLLVEEQWPEEIGPLQVRMALHTGEVERRGNDYFGQSLNRVARILAAGHGGQILLSQITRGLIRDALPVGVSLRDLGEHRLKDIQSPETIFQVMLAGFPSEFPPLKTLDRHPNNLPTQLTPFVGRKQELEAVSTLLLQREVRLTTLVGPGGTGKTRLGLQVVAEIADHFPDGVYFVDLSSLRGIDAVITAIAQVLNLRDVSDRTVLEHLKEHLQGSMLLLLDNFEQVIEAAPIVHELLIASRTLKILITSRAILHLHGEHEFRVNPLIVPELKPPFDVSDLSQYDAITLFIQQAQTVKSDFRLSDTNVSAVVDICRRLDGLPLAIELAAARINLLPPQAMLKRLKYRLNLLKDGKRDRAERQQTLRHTISWSYDLLDEEEKMLFTWLSIFQNGCTLEAIEEVCPIEEFHSDLLDILNSLVDKSLLRQQWQESEEARFMLLSTIREFAQEQLAATEKEAELLQRHLFYYLKLAEQANPALIGSEQKLWLNRLEGEHDNLQAALDWCEQNKQTEVGLRLAGSLWRFWLMHGHLYTGRSWLERLLSEDDTAPPQVKAKALEGAFILACRQKDHERATTLANEALQLAQPLGLEEVMSSAYATLAEISMSRGDSQHATELFEKSLQLERTLGNKRGVAGLLNNLGNVALQQGKVHRSAMLLEESLFYFREIGDKLSIASVLNNLGEVERHRRNFEQAAILYEESLQLSRELHYTWGIAAALVNLGDVTYVLKKYEPALHTYQESLQLFYELGDKLGVVLCLEGIATVCASLKFYERATRLFAQSDIIRQALESAGQQAEHMMHENTIVALQTTLGSNLFDALWTTGRALLREQAIAEALSIKTV
ncbi:MAG TPA: tetratricopeptide repeat protein [Ktedonosporobacter sp.]|nr:tetratricopeptide repeat protein [Ktedonosporobacter sp.]